MNKVEGSFTYNFMFSYKQFGTNALIYPGSAFLEIFTICFRKIELYMDKYCIVFNLKDKLVSTLITENIISLGCNMHNLNRTVIDTIVYYFLLFWTKNINKSLKGLDCFATKTHYNKIRLSACNVYEKYLRKRVKIEKMKKLK